MCLCENESVSLSLPFIFKFPDILQPRSHLGRHHQDTNKDTLHQQPTDLARMNNTNKHKAMNIVMFNQWESFANLAEKLNEAWKHIDQLLDEVEEKNREIGDLENTVSYLERELELLRSNN